MDDASIARGEKRWPNYWGLAVVILVTLLAGFYFYDFVYFVPPISATVVDAITGKPVPGMRACLQVDSNGMGHHEVLRKRVSRSNTQGEVSFSPSIHRMMLLQNWEGYSLRVTDPRNDFATPCGPDLGPGLNEIFPNQGMPNTGPSYFPVVLVKPGMHTSNKSIWSDTRRRMGFPYGMRVAVIPMLANADECKHAQEPLLVEACLRLNAEARAIYGSRQ